MLIFEYRREITRRMPDSFTGRIKDFLVTEAVFIKAANREEADILIEPFNYKKHIRYRAYRFYESLSDDVNKMPLNKIVVLKAE